MTPILIARRANTLQRDPDKENTPEQINVALKRGFFVDIDVYLLDNDFLSLSESLDDIIDESLLENSKIFVNCMSEDCFNYLSGNLNIQCFYLGEESETHISNCEGTIVRNSQGNKMVSKNRIIVFPGNYEEFKAVYKTAITPYGICTDYPESFRYGFEKEMKSFPDEISSKRVKTLNEFVRDIQTKDWKTA